ncbi:YveK family protein [Streptomyces tsukubensis]|uniref:lipopolysaccharide biosynthesis protein n=1 Tax=Streptomyces tsukubensis TaxID=83656 RepID=UPI001E5A3752|nr:lipopolysaccharide biosynthesis protein [Streptomyces tsukubensis]
MTKPQSPQTPRPEPREPGPERAGKTDRPEPAPAPAPARSRRPGPLRWAANRSRRLPVWWPLPALAAAGALCGSAYGLLATPQYAATSFVVAVTGKDAQPGAALGFAQAYGRVATSDSTIAYARVAAAMSAQELRSRVRTETSPDSPMIAITGTSDRPGEAADIANAVADAVFVSGNQVAKNTGVQLLSFSRAIPPAEPVSPSAPLGAAVGAATGGLIGGLVLLVRPRARHRSAGTGTETGSAGRTPAAPASVPAPATAAQGSAAGKERV